MTQHIHEHRLLVLDFGSQFSQMIARRIREVGVYCELWDWEATHEEVAQFAPQGIILASGPGDILADDADTFDRGIFKLGLPMLGVGYGARILLKQLGANFSKEQKSQGYKVTGLSHVQWNDKAPLMTKFDQFKVDPSEHEQVWLNLDGKITTLPAGFESYATFSQQENGQENEHKHVFVADTEKHYYALQFHPELEQTGLGLTMLANFALQVCGCKPRWTSESIIEHAIQNIREQVGQDKVILGLSGGVDSSVTAMLLHKAIGSQLTCVFVDHGLLRLNEADQVMEMFGNKFGLNIVRADAEEQFMQALQGQSDPEDKRKTIGRVFIDVFDYYSKQIEGARWLAQGTIYPDVIESAAAKTGKAEVIKSHHNVGGLPEDMKLGLVEPLRDLFKDEVRKIGLELGIPYDMLYRHPFPGPGLGIRVLGEIKKEYCDILRQADAIFIEELFAADWYHKTSQAFAVFLPIKSVGVIADKRRYDWVISLRAVETVDFMTARWAHLPYELIDKVSNRIIREVDGVSRVVYDVSGKPPATIEWE